MGDRVLQQAGHHPVQRIGITMHPDRRVRCIHREGVARIQHQRCHVGGHFAGQCGQVDALGLAAVVIQPLQVQQLLGDVAEPAQVTLQARARRARWQVVDARGQDRDRHAQFVRRPDQETVLRVVALADAAHRRVEGIHQREDLGRHRVGVQATAAFVDLDRRRLRGHPVHPAQ
ncbi:hypothetical protein D3C71_1600320 [compost metagenome]